GQDKLAAAEPVEECQTVLHQCSIVQIKYPRGLKQGHRKFSDCSVFVTCGRYSCCGGYNEGGSRASAVKAGRHQEKTTSSLEQIPARPDPQSGKPMKCLPCHDWHSGQANQHDRSRSSRSLGRHTDRMVIYEKTYSHELPARPDPGRGWLRLQPDR